MQSRNIFFIRQILKANLGFAMFGTPFALLFIQELKATSLFNAIGVVGVAFVIFIVMYLGLDIIIRAFNTSGRS